MQGWCRVTNYYPEIEIPFSEYQKIQVKFDPSFMVLVQKKSKNSLNGSKIPNLVSSGSRDK